MNDFELNLDIEIVTDLLNITASDLAEGIGVTPTTISRWRKNEEQASASNLNSFYNFAFNKGLARQNGQQRMFFLPVCSRRLRQSRILLPLRLLQVLQLLQSLHL